MPKTGLLLTNLGTPDSPNVADVRRYLRQFLSDPRVLDMHAVARWALLNLVILPFRPAKSAAAYKKVWTAQGSPLLVHSQALTQKVAALLPHVCVRLAMRYGNPSTAAALAHMRSVGVERVVVFPLYPQYAASSTGSAVEEVIRVVAQQWNVLPISVVEPFYGDTRFVDAFAQVMQATLSGFDAQHVLFSFHGLPERHCTASDVTGAHCLKVQECCSSMVSANRHCYRAQCHVTAKLLATKCGLDARGWSLSFQSRLGNTPWIQPFTDEVLPQLAAKGIKRLAVVCPAFVADCLETVEEIGMRAAQSFVAAGGEALTLVPSLNAQDVWAHAVVGMATDHSGWLKDGWLRDAGAVASAPN